MREFQGRTVRYVAYGLGCRSKFRISRHHSRHIRPDFKKSGIDTHSKQRSSIVRASAAQSCGPATFIRSDESRHHKQRNHRIVFNKVLNVLRSLAHIHRRRSRCGNFCSITKFYTLGHLYKLPGIHPLCGDAD